MNGYRVTLALPQDQGDFLQDEEPEVVKILAWVPTARIQASGEAVSIQLIKVSIEFSGPISAAAKKIAVEKSDAENDKAPLSEFANAAQRCWEEGRAIAEQATHSWLSHIRVVSNQAWLGVAVEAPCQYGRSRILDGDTNVWLMEFGSRQSATIRSGLLALSLEKLQEVQRRVMDQEEPSAAEVLLADARFLVQEAEVVDSQRAILIAAIAAEIKCKQIIREKADPSKAELLNLILRRTSNLPQLLEEICPAALGQSLKVIDLPLFEKIKRLNELRNHVVHRGVQVDRVEGWQLVVAAGQLFEWLDSF
jgi:hypothetical protein